MIWIEACRFRMGADGWYAEEAPSRHVSVDGFWIDETPVTNADFAQFIDATGYVTLAETPPNPADYPGMPAAMARAGSLVFTPTSAPVDTANVALWWAFRFGAHWRDPLGDGRAAPGDHPVVHVTLQDAAAYARWAEKDLPTEAEWEAAARGGLDGATYAWGEEFTPGGRHMANTWQGGFPFENLEQDGFARTSPVRAFPPNGFGVYDMIGNVWEWTSDWYSGARAPTSPCCTPHNPVGGPEAQSYDPSQAELRIPRKVIKGGSHLCAPSYCKRYRPAARHPQAIDTSTSHLGFRCVRRG